MASLDSCKTQVAEVFSQHGLSLEFVSSTKGSVMEVAYYKLNGPDGTYKIPSVPGFLIAYDQESNTLTIAKAANEVVEGFFTTLRHSMPNRGMDFSGSTGDQLSVTIVAGKRANRLQIDQKVRVCARPISPGVRVETDIFKSAMRFTVKVPS